MSCGLEIADLTLFCVNEINQNLQRILYLRLTDDKDKPERCFLQIRPGVWTVMNIFTFAFLMKKAVKDPILLFVLLVLTLSSCGTAKYLEEDQKLLDNNKVELEGTGEGVSAGALESLAKQKPNRKFLGVFRVKEWAYFRSEKGKDNWFNRWLANSVANDPVILDTNLCHSSLEQMDLYLQNKGYFSNTLGFTVNSGRVSATVRYNIEAGKEYRLRVIRSTVRDSILQLFMNQHFTESLLEEGMVYDVDQLDDERDRIVRLLKDYGYYGFSKEYISYRIDSTVGDGRMDVEMVIANPPGLESHPRYRVSRIYIHTDYDPLKEMSKDRDTIVVADKSLDFEKPPALYYIISDGELIVNPDVLIQNLFIDPGMYFSISSVERTYRRLSDLRLFRLVNIQIKDANNETDHANRGLICDIRLSPAKLNAFSIETEGTNSAGDLGIAGNLVYENRNLFHGAETFNVRLKGAMEVQRVPDGAEEEFLIFNTFETGIQAGLKFPRFLLPVNLDQFPRLYEPYTNFDLSYNIRQRPNYRRIASKLAFGYEWKESNTRRHILYPADLNAVNIISDSTFDPGAFGPLYEAQYSDHLSAALKYSFIYNSQPVAGGGNFLYFRGNFSSSGNFLNLAHGILNIEAGDDGYYSLMKIRYAQYIRIDGDLRFYQVLLPGQSMAYRFAAGVGVPYGNSDVLPFEQGFFAGGANGMRGWEVRSLGPGGYIDPDNSRYDKIGDLMIEANVEYRFPVYRYLKGALFTDAGNIWLLEPNSSFPDGHIELGTLASEIAIDAGIGFRLDFGFFLFRIDSAMPVRDPGRSKGERWMSVSSMQFSDLVWNFGIGYPF